MTDAAIDPAAFAKLVEITGGDLEFVDELVDTYLQDGVSQVAALRAAAESGSPEDLVRPAHTLKSSSLNVGALELGALSRSLEEAARQGPLADAAARVEAIAASFEAARRALLDARERRAQG
jgi:HPt (histidine-containing phosphotransfer) domain-containing protein